MSAQDIIHVLVKTAWSTMTVKAVLIKLERLGFQHFAGKMYSHKYHNLDVVLEYDNYSLICKDVVII